MLSPPARAGFFKGNEMLKIKSVDKRSAGKRLGAKKGWSLAAFDGREVVDILDYEYYDSQESFSVDFETPEGTKRFEVERARTKVWVLNLKRSAIFPSPVRAETTAFFALSLSCPRG